LCAAYGNTAPIARIVVGIGVAIACTASYSGFITQSAYIVIGIIVLFVRQRDGYIVLSLKNNLPALLCFSILSICEKCP